MKFCLGLLIAMPLFITACKKDHDDNKFNPNKDYGCIERIYSNKNDHIINSADVADVNKLFADNNIDNSNFRYLQYKVDSLQACVVVEQYAKGVNIFTANTIFYFTKGILSYDPRTPIDVTRLDSIAHVQLPYLKWMFLNDVREWAKGLSRNYVDSCLYTELGFYQLPGNVNTAGKFVKAWRVTGKAIYPIGFYNDDDGSRISYSNGIFLY